MCLLDVDLRSIDLWLVACNDLLAMGVDGISWGLAGATRAECGVESAFDFVSSGLTGAKRAECAVDLVSFGRVGATKGERRVEFAFDLVSLWDSGAARVVPLGEGFEPVRGWIGVGVVRGVGGG